MGLTPNIFCSDYGIRTFRGQARGSGTVMMFRSRNALLFTVGSESDGGPGFEIDQHHVTQQAPARDDQRNIRVTVEPRNRSGCRCQ